MSEPWTPPSVTLLAVPSSPLPELGGGCLACAFTGWVCDDDMVTPWRYTPDMPADRAAAVLYGTARPATCPHCGAS